MLWLYASSLLSAVSKMPFSSFFLGFLCRFLPCFHLPYLVSRTVYTFCPNYHDLLIVPVTHDWLYCFFFSASLISVVLLPARTWVPLPCFLFFGVTNHFYSSIYTDPGSYVVTPSKRTSYPPRLRCLITQIHCTNSQNSPPRIQPPFIIRQSPWSDQGPSMIYLTFGCRRPCCCPTSRYLCGIWTNQLREKARRSGSDDHVLHHRVRTCFDPSHPPLIRPRSSKGMDRGLCL